MILRRIFDLLQLDKTLGYALLTRIWQAISGPLTIAFVVKYMDKDETGVYTVLIGVLGIQTLFELGLLNVLIGHAGHAAGALKDASGEKLTEARARMSELIRASQVWFGGASVLFSIASISIGWITLSRSDTQVAWSAALLSLIPIVALTIYLSPLLAILEGSGDRELIYKVGFLARFVGTFVVWSALLFGFGIWALVASAAVQTAFSAVVPLVLRSSFFRQYRGLNKQASEFSWMKDVVPAQWRMAAVAAAYHFATQYFVIILANYYSTEEAGRLGLTLLITSAIQMFALAWVQTKFSLISQMHADGQREEAGTLWRQTAIISTTLLVIMFIVLTAILYFLPNIQSVLESFEFKKRDLPSRFITPTQCAIYGIGCLANHFVALQGFYVLARKANPLVIASVTGFLTVTLMIWYAGANFAADGIVIAFALGVSLIALPLHTWSYLRFRSADLN